MKRLSAGKIGFNVSFHGQKPLCVLETKEVGKKDGYLEEGEEEEGEEGEEEEEKEEEEEELTELPSAPGKMEQKKEQRN